jgi:acyl-CoA dehydrogenase
VKDGNHWVINGQKVFITGGNEADFTMVFAVTDRNKPPQNGGVTCFLVDREMGWTSRPVPTMGGWSPAELFFENVCVPEDHILGEVGKGFSLGMQWIGQGRWLIAARCVGTAERLLQMAVDYAKQRVTFGQPIADRQAIQWMLADSKVEIEATKWLALYAAMNYSYTTGQRLVIGISRPGKSSGMVRVSPSRRVVPWGIDSPVSASLLSPPGR